MIRAVIYAAKSTQDKKDSIPEQLADARAMCEEQGWTVIGEYTDEGFSAYSGNRGPGLLQARRHAARAAAEHGTIVMLVAQAHDRFARGAGDQPNAPESLGEIWHAMRRQNVWLRTVEDDEELRDEASVAAIGRRAHIDSKRKSKATRKGLARRRRRGEPVGAVPLGYRADEGERVVDEAGAALYQRMVEDNENGLRPGDTSRLLNADGERTQRDQLWTTRAVRRVLRNEAHVGESGYPALIDRERWERVQQRLDGNDPVGAQARKGGRQARPDFLLAGVGFCGKCGAPMRSRRYRNGTRVYRCRDTMEGIGTCSTGPIPADMVETHVVAHLEHMVGEQLTSWLAERAHDHQARYSELVAGAQREHEHTRALTRLLARAEQQYRRLLGTDEMLADEALREVARLRADVDAQQERADDADAHAAEFASTPDQQAALNHMTYLAAMLGGRLHDAQGGAEINMVLRRALQGIWMVGNRDGFRAEVEAHMTGTHDLAGDTPELRREALQECGVPPEWLRQAEPRTFPDGPASHTGLVLPPLVVTA